LVLLLPLTALLAEMHLTTCSLLLLFCLLPLQPW
jgi:hypothetical protein